MSLCDDYVIMTVLMIMDTILFPLRKWGPHKKQRRKFEEDPEKEVASVLCLFPGS